MATTMVLTRTHHCGTWQKRADKSHTANQHQRESISIHITILQIYAAGQFHSNGVCLHSPGNSTLLAHMAVCVCVRAYYDGSWPIECGIARVVVGVGEFQRTVYECIIRLAIFYNANCISYDNHTCTFYDSRRVNTELNMRFFNTRRLDFFCSVGLVKMRSMLIEPMLAQKKKFLCRGRHRQKGEKELSGKEKQLACLYHIPSFYNIFLVFLEWIPKFECKGFMRVPAQPNPWAFFNQMLFLQLFTDRIAVTD